MIKVQHPNSVEVPSPPPSHTHIHKDFSVNTDVLQLTCTRKEAESQYNDEFKLIIIGCVVLHHTVIINDRKLYFTASCSSASSFRLLIKLLAMKNNSLFRLLSVAFMSNGVIGLVARKRKRSLNVDSWIS
jgi:hypothetical protein